MESRHSEVADKPLEYFQRKKNDLKLSIQNFCRYTTVNEKCLLLSFLVAYHIERKKMAHATAENIIL